MTSSKKIVIDTSAFYALISSTDTFHIRAKSAYERVLDLEWELWTTSYIMVETSALVHHRLGFDFLKSFSETILSDIFHVVWIEKAIHTEAWRRMMQRQGKTFSLVDWTTMVVAERIKGSVFTFDQGFSQQGILTFPR